MSEKKNILIVGITGFLGSNLLNYIFNNFETNKYNIIGIARDQERINSLQKKFHNIKICQIDIFSQNIELEDLFTNNKIDYILNTAALKCVDECEKNPILCVEVNLIGFINLLKLANKFNVKNMISISTDKANKPINNYGMSKYLMQQISKQYKYSIYEGVNFFWSNNSVLDIWFKQIKNKENICVTNFDQERYFIDIDDVCKDILDNIDKRNIIIKSKNIYKIKLIDLFNSFTEYFKYDKTKCSIKGNRTNEKVSDEINQKFVNLDNEEIKNKIDKYVKNKLSICI